MKADTNLTKYLFRTICPKRKGLRVKLKISTVNSCLETFDEKENPAATIMSHGLFLAKPTSFGIKDPVVLAVSNQADLKDDEPNSEFGVFWASRRLKAYLETAAPKPATLEEGKLGKRSVIDPASATERKEIVWMAQNVCLIKHGIMKAMPHSIYFDINVSKFFEGNLKQYFFKNLQTQSIPELKTCILTFGPEGIEERLGDPYKPQSAFAKNPTHLFLSYMQYLLNSYNSTKTGIAQHSVIVPEAETALSPDKVSKSTSTSALNLTALSSIGNLLMVIYSNLVYYKKFQLPKVRQDLAAFLALIHQAQNQLAELSAIILKLLLDPFCEVLSGFSVRRSSSSQQTLPDDCEELHIARKTIQKLLELAKKPLCSMSAADAPPDQAGLSDPKLLQLMSKCLDYPAFSRTFFRRLQVRLDSYPVDQRNIQNIAEYLEGHLDYTKASLRLFKATYITESFNRVADKYLSTIPDQKYCVVRNAKTNNRTKFCPGLTTNLAWKLIAVICSADTKLCIMIEELPKKKKKQQKPPPADNEGNGQESEDSVDQPGTTTHVKVFHKDAEVTSFSLEPNFILATGRCAARTIQYFTGRYFVKFDGSDDLGFCDMMVLDLAPCLEQPPRAPIYKYEKLENFLGEDEALPVAYSCTDKFLSYMTTDENDVDAENYYTGKPVLIKIIPFEGPTGLKPLAVLNCAELFDQITEKVTTDRVYQDSGYNTQMCWSKDLRKVFYTYSRLEEEANSPMTLFIACFEVSKQLDTIKTLTFNLYHLNHLLNDELFSKKLPRFRSLRTKAKEYLVMDLMNPLKWDDQLATGSPTILARALFTVHKNKLHWVPVNGKLIAPFPQEIGDEMAYAGYETAQISVFHQRRVFCSDKVTSFVSRLDYQPL